MAIFAVEENDDGSFTRQEHERRRRRPRRSDSGRYQRRYQPTTNGNSSSSDSPRPTIANNSLLIKQQQQEPRFRRLYCPHSDLESESSTSNVFSTDSSSSTTGSHRRGNRHDTNHVSQPQIPAYSRYVGLDCEMVGTLTGESMAARVVLVNWNGEIILDAYIQPDCQVTDYRTFVSGITAQDLEKHGQDIAVVQAKVKALIHDKILVGHGLPNDLKCLAIEHPWYLLRDTAYYEPFMQKRQQQQPQQNYNHYKHLQLNNNDCNVLLPRKLKVLVAEQLNRSIQIEGSPHHPAEDAVAALDLYKLHRIKWEKLLRSRIIAHARQQKKQLRQMQRQQYQQYHRYYSSQPQAYT